MPYTIEEASVSDAALAQSTDAGFGKKRAALAPPNSARWQLGGEEWSAPSEHVFVSALEPSGIGDRRGVVALARHTLRPREVSVVYLRAHAPPTVFLLAGVESCDAEPRRERLESLSETEVLVEIPETCEGHRRQALVLKVQEASFAIRFRALVEDPQGMSSSVLDVSSEDLDGDGVADLTLRLSDAAIPSASVPLRFFDRSSGLSQDSAEPNGSILKFSADLREKGVKANEILPRVAAYRELLIGVCENKTRLRLEAGRACPELPALVDLMNAEARMRLVSGDALGAAALFREVGERLSSLANGEKRSEAYAKALRASLPVVSDGSIRELSAKPTRVEGSVHAAPIEFDQAGTLEVVTEAGVVQANLKTSEEIRVGSSVWNLSLVSPSQTRRLFEAQCEPRGTFGHTFAAAAQIDDRDVMLRTNACSTPRSAVVRPVVATDDGLTLLVDGEPVTLNADFSTRRGTLDRAKAKHVKGGAASPLAKWSVAPVSLFGSRLTGLLVAGAKPRLFQARELESAIGSLQDCVINDPGDSIACIRNERVVIGTWRAP